MLGRTDSRTRLLLLLMVFVVASVALLGRLAYWQVLQRDMLAAKAIAQTTVRLEEPTRRGEIYDRSGTVVLATTVERDRLVAATNKLTADQRRQTGDELTQILGLDAEGAAALRERLASGKAYIILAREIEPTIADRIRAASASRRITGISLEPEPLRIYPQDGGSPDSSLASHLLGFVNRDGIGQYGVEQSYQDVLTGTPRVVVAERDANGRSLLYQATVVDTGVPGQDVRLTIDAGLQLAVEQELLAAWVADKARTVSAVVMDPYTGEVYAQATVPGYDANLYRQIADTAPERFIDPVVSNVYEPGSVFKMMTAAAALETGSVSLSTRIKDVGTLHLDRGKTKVDDADRKAKGWMTFADIVAWSRNVGATQVAIRLGKTTAAASAALYQTWQSYGIGQKTGVDLAGEVSGGDWVRDPAAEPWSQI
ncbi:MAG: peptidoglycan D,D-transpeptidase FtsI family protein, partial [Candidatus Limnocylindrales bacterium]